MSGSSGASVGSSSKGLDASTYSFASGAGSLSGGIAAIGAGYSQAKAYEIQGDYQSAMARMNAQIADVQAEDAIRRGDSAVATHKKQVKGLIGEQRASLAAQGVALDDGSALDIQTTTATLGALDEITLKNNAYREAWGYRAGGQSAQANGNFASILANANSNSSLLTGGIQAVNASATGAYKISQGFK